MISETSTIYAAPSSRDYSLESRHRSSAFATPRLAVGLSQSALHSLATPVYGTLCSAAVSYRTTLWLNSSDFTLIHRYVCGIESKRLTPVLLRFQWMWPSEANLVTLRLLNLTRAVDAGLFRQQVRAKQKRTYIKYEFSNAIGGSYYLIEYNGVC